MNKSIEEILSVLEYSYDKTLKQRQRRKNDAKKVNSVFNRVKDKSVH